VSFKQINRILLSVVMLWSTMGVVGALSASAAISAGSLSQAPWKEGAPATSPRDTSIYSSMAYDESSGNTVLFGGYIGNAQASQNTTWIWNGNTWTDVTPTDPNDSPPPRISAVMAYTGDGILLFGGFNHSILPKTRYNDTWLWDGTKWTEVTTTSSPPPRSESTMVYIGNGQVLLYGGAGNGVLRLADTWLWDGMTKTWTDVTPSDPTESPPGLNAMHIAYDEINQEVVLYGGIYSGGTNDATWIWNGAIWEKRNVTQSPPGRIKGTMAYDKNLGRTVLLGGYYGPTNNAQLREDMWVWDGTDWSEIQGIDLPPERYGAVMVYDSQRAQLVLFGGEGENGIFEDTWTYRTSEVHSVSITPQSYVSMGTTNWDMSFTTSKFGDLLHAGDTITLKAPAGVVFPTEKESYMIDGVESLSVVQTALNLVTITVPTNISSNSPVNLAVSSVTNPGFGSYQPDEFSVATSQDIVWSNPLNALSFVLGPHSIELTASETEISVNSSVTVQGAVYDSNQQPIVGSVVDLAATAGSLNPISVVSDVYGKFSSTFTAPATSGTIAITAAISPSIQGTLQIIVTSPNPGGSGDSGSSVGPGTLPTSKDYKMLVIPKGEAGEIVFDNDIIVIVPTGATNQSLQISIEKILKTDSLGAINLQNMKLISSIFEVLKNVTDDLSKEVTIKIKLYPNVLGEDEHAAIFYYDEVKKEWIDIGGVIENDYMVVETTHFTKFALFAVDNAVEAPSELMLTDIQSHWAEEAIRQAIAAGIVKGYEDHTFRPQQKVTRAEFAVMLARALDLKDDDSSLSYKDSKQIPAWARTSIVTATRLGIVKGYEDGTFRPFQSISRAEMAAMIIRVLNGDNSVSTELDFVDSSEVPAWAEQSMKTAVATGLIIGDVRHYLNPNAATTRAEAVVLLIRMMNLEYH
jgi:hypothetical protein